MKTENSSSIRNRQSTLALAGMLWTSLLAALPTTLHAQFTYTTNDDGTINIAWYTGPGGDVVIPSTINDLPVTTVGDFAFAELTNITSVTVPDGVTSVGYDAFHGCLSLGTALLPDSVTFLGGVAFGGCYNLTNVTIPNRLGFIMRSTFDTAISLTGVQIPNSVTNIDSFAFARCSSLANVTIPSSVTNIGDYAFCYCTNLRSVWFEGNAPMVHDLNDVTMFYPAAGSAVLMSGTNTTVYYPPGTTGWSDIFSYRPTVLWSPQMNAVPGVAGRNAFGFTTSWARGMTVVVEASASLASPVWVPVATNILTSGSYYFSDPYCTNYLSRFYRVRW